MQMGGPMQMQQGPGGYPGSSGMPQQQQMQQIQQIQQQMQQQQFGMGGVPELQRQGAGSMRPSSSGMMGPGPGGYGGHMMQQPPAAAGGGQGVYLPKRVC